MDNILIKDEKKKKKFYPNDIDISINKLPIINGKTEDMEKIKNINSNEKNENSSLKKFENQNKKKGIMKKKLNLENILVKYHPKIRTNSDFVNNQFMTNCMNTQNTYYNTNSNDNESGSKQNSSIQFFKISNFFNNNNSKKKTVKLNKKSLEERDLNEIISGRSKEKTLKKGKHKTTKTQQYKQIILIDSENEVNGYLSNFSPKTYGNFYIDKDNMNIKLNNNLKKPITRQLTKSPNKKKKTLFYNYDESSFESLNPFIENYYWKKNLKFFNLTQYLKEERKKLNITRYLSYGKKISLEKVKNDLLINSKNLITEKKNKLLKNKKIEFSSIKNYINNLYHVFFYEYMTSKNLKKFETFLLKDLIIDFSIIQIPNLQYILHKFFSIYDQVIQYIFTNDTENNIFTNIKSCDSIHYINLYKILRKAYKNNLNRIFLNDIISNDFKIVNIFQEINFKKAILIQRKKTRKKKKGSLISFLKVEKGRKNSIFEDISSVVKKTKEEIDKKDIKFKFLETNSYIEKWNPHFNKNFLMSRNKKILTENQLIETFLKKKKQIKSKLKWKKNMELLRNLGGDPMSQANSLLRTYEFQEKNINSPRFERLFQLIERGQNLLFEKEFSQFNDKINNKLKKTGDTLLIQAVRYANEPIIEFLINQGCDLNAQNYLGNTALHIAFLNNNLNIVNMLICCGAKEFILNNNGLTPWESRKQYYK